MIDDIKMSTTDHHHPSNSTSKLEQGAFDIFDFTTKTAGSNATGGGASGIGMDGGVENVNNISRNSDAFDTGQSGTDPWSDVTWGRGALLMNTSTSNTAAHAADGETVETEDVFEFSTTDNDDNIADSLLLEELLVEGDAQHQQHQQLDDDDNGEQEEASRLFFPSADDFFREVPEDPATVHVAMHEQLSAIYDDTSEDPACQVEGSIHVKPSAEMANSPFSLVLRDLMGHLKSVKDRVGGTGGTAAGDYSYSYCQDVTDKVSRQGLHKSDRVFRVTLPPNVLSNGEVPIAQYICSSRVRPVPLLIKSRVQVSTKFSRVGFKIRANPSNEHSMTHLVIMLAVPPHVDGRSAKMSRRGGVWDEMKRTISWVVQKLDPGEALEVQAQFASIDGETDRTPKFPVLVRGDYPSIFSSLELKADFRDVLAQPINMKLNLSGRVLHRKV